MLPDARILAPAELRAARVRLGLSQVAMARAVGASLRTYIAWEVGERPAPATVDPATRALLAEAGREAA